jgi:hypothetical protein
MSPAISRLRILFRPAIGFVALALANGAWPTMANAQGAEPALSGAKSQERGACSIVRIEFHRPVMVLSHAPQGTSDELRIMVKPATPVTQLAGAARENVRPPGGANDIHAIEYERDGAGSTLKLYFRRTATFQVAAGTDARSVIVAVAARGTTGPCIAKFDDAVAVSGAQVPSPGTPVTAQLKPSLNQDGDKLSALMVDARAAMAAKQDDRALQLLTQVNDTGDSKVRAEALELMGVVRERKGHMAHARAEYQQYLTLFPAGHGAKRVKDRLALMDAKDKAAFDQAKAGGVSAGDAAKTPVVLGNPGDKAPALRGVDLPSMAEREEAKNLDAWNITRSGSVSATYQRNQGGRDFFTAPKQNRGWEKENIYQVYQNSAVGTVDDDTSFENRRFKGALHVSASDEHKFMGQSPADDLRISQLYLDGTIKGVGLSGRVGRQSKYTSGILGRFDGAIASYEISERYKINAVAGSPVERAHDGAFKNERIFYGTSVDFKPFGRNGAFEGNAYIIEQRSEGYIDRQSIGAETRFSDAMNFGLVNLDYDTHYNTINMAMLNGTKIFADRSSLSTSLDYRRSPMVFTTNAMQGQGTLTLKELLQRYRLDEVETFALDRTARSTAGTVSYTKPISERYSFNADVTVTNMTSTKASANVPATPDSGYDVYTSANLTGTSIIREGDVLIGGLRYADTQTAHRYMAELSTRQPIQGNTWYANPMLRLGFVDYKGDNDMREYHVMPTFRTSYYWTPALSLDFELGQKWIVQDSHKGRANDQETLLLTGIRYDYNSDRRLP